MHARLFRRAVVIALGVFVAGFFATLFFLLVVSPCIGDCVQAAQEGAESSATSSAGGMPPSSSGTAGTPPGSSEEPPTSSAHPSEPPPIPAPSSAPFVYSFNADATLSEAGKSSQSTSPYWFLDSGGELIIANGIGQTVHGVLPLTNRWRLAYALDNPRDTDSGTHPQNIFRLVTKQSWEDASVSLSYRIDADNLSASEYRNESNGLLLMTRYRDHDTLYYAGIRVDGTAVIKKKYAGTYYTMAQAPVFPGVYDRAASPNLLPHGEWISLRVDTVENADGSVTVSLFIAKPGVSGWTRALTAIDDGKKYGGTPPITGAGLAGVRTDFMDVSFKDFRVTAL